MIWGDLLLYLHQVAFSLLSILAVSCIFMKCMRYFCSKRNKIWLIYLGALTLNSTRPNSHLIHFLSFFLLLFFSLRCAPIWWYQQVFTKLKQQDKEEKFRHKIVPIEGDCSLPGLGISESDRRKLIDNVHIILHAAATVRFDEKLKLALAINVNGTKEIMILSKQLKTLVVSYF